MIDLKELIDRLNPEQKQAVDAIYGTSFVEAPPGSGKTQLLACRVAKLLKSEAMVSPSTILLLTYTDAGTKAMRKRLFDFIGAEAYQVNIHTFHSFCSDIIQNNLSFFKADELEPVSELESLEIAMGMIKELSIDHILKRSRGDIYYEAKRLLALFQIMKNEAWNDEHVWEGIAEKRRFIPDEDKMFSEVPDYKQDSYYDTFKEIKGDEIIHGYPREYFYLKANKKSGVRAGDLKTAKIQEIKDKLNMLYAAAALLGDYNKKLKEAGRYDFSDMIHFVLNAFESDDFFLLNQQEKYQYMIIDEFQDTSGLQNKLINKLMDYWDDPNILVVADSDQCLYEFSGARIQAMKDFADRYNPTMIFLKSNYRSYQDILDPCINLIRNSTDSLSSQTGVKKELISQVNNPGIGYEPFVKECNNTFEEEFYLVEQIEVLHESGVPYSEIAIIYRKHKHSDNILTELRNKEIPVNVKRKVNILNEVLIQQLIYILRHFSVIGGNDTSKEQFGRLFQIFHYPYFEVNPTSDLHEWAIQHRLDSKKDFESIDKAKKIIDSLTGEYYNLSPLQLLVKILNETGMLQYCNTRDNKIHLLSVLTTFVNFMKGEVFKNPLLTMAQFLSSIDVMIYRGIQIPLLDINFSEDGVNFITGHGAKGLEFDHVFIMRACRSEWEKARTISSTYYIPETLSYAKEQDKIESTRRLFYVAMSRARKGLVVTYPKTNEVGRDMEASQFIEESEMVVIPASKDVSRNKAEHLTDQLLDKVIKFSPSLEKGILESFVENYRISVSHITKYLTCGLSFYYENVLKIPFVASRALLYGNGVHHAFELFYNALRDGQPINDKLLIKKFVDYINKNRGQVNEDDFKLLFNLGMKELSLYYRKYLSRLDKFVGLNEYNVNILIDGIPAKIVIDRVQFDGNYADLYDYKTGKYENAIKHMHGPTEKDPLGGNYWTQGVFYKVGFNAIQHKPWTARNVYFELIDSGAKSNLYELSISREDELIVLGQMKQAYEGIKALKFEGCGDKDCYWCNFDDKTKEV